MRTVEAEPICQVCETAPGSEACPKDCRYCAKCADGLERKCRNCGGPITSVAVEVDLAG